MQLGDPLEGLLHDATEAYLSDIPAPLKRKFPDVYLYDHEIDALFRKQFSLPPTKSEECDKADKLALFIEAYWLSPSEGKIYYDPWNLRDKALEYKELFKPVCYSPCDAKECFRYYYRKLALIHPNVPQLPKQSPILRSNFALSLQK